MAAPTTPTDASTKPMDASFSTMSAMAVAGSPPPHINSPVAFRRQNAKECLGEASESENATSDESVAVYLGDDSDSDSGLEMSERLKQRLGWIRQEWRDLRGHNASHGCTSESWPRYEASVMPTYGWTMINGQWIKTGQISKHNRDRRASSKSKALAKPKAKTPVIKSAAAKKLKKPAASMKSMKVLVKSMKAMKVSSAASGSKGSPKQSTGSPCTPNKGTNKKSLVTTTPKMKSPLATPPKHAPRQVKRSVGLKSSPLKSSPSKSSPLKSSPLKSSPSSTGRKPSTQ